MVLEDDKVVEIVAQPVEVIEGEPLLEPDEQPEGDKEREPVGDSVGDCETLADDEKLELPLLLCVLVVHPVTDDERVTERVGEPDGDKEELPHEETETVREGEFETHELTDAE